MRQRLRTRTILYGAFTWASLKAYFRNPVAMFFSLFFPLAFLLIFGLFNFGEGEFNMPSVAIVDQARNADSERLVGALEELEVEGLEMEKMKVLETRTDASEAEYRMQLADDQLHVLLIIPSNFTLSGEPNASELELHFAATRFAELGAAQQIISAVLNGLFVQSQQIPDQFLADSYYTLGEPQPEARTDGTFPFSYIVFLIPGLLAMAAMQSSIFGSVFTLIRFKVSGVLKRLQATPAGPMPVLVSQGLNTVVVLVLQSALVIGVAVAAFPEFRDVALERGALSILSVLFLILLGGSIFVGAGLAISGTGKNEQGASAVANLVTFPMLFLSGVFFPTDVLPDWLELVTRYLPLSFMIDSMREVMLNGAQLWDSRVALDILGMAVWSIALFAVARLTFRWE